MKVFNEKNLVESVVVDFDLTNREFDVLLQAANGCNRTEIANNLGIMHSTVSSYLKQIYKKLSVRNRSAAVAVAFKRGLINLDSAKAVVKAS
jgi:DNA-binding NarL/FixJ family response regulator